MRQATQPPTRYGKSRLGCYFELTNRGVKDAHGVRRWRLRFLGSGLKSTLQWSMRDFEAARVRWLKNRPARKVTR